MPDKTLPVRLLLTLSYIPGWEGGRYHVLGMLDETAHKLHFPKLIQRPLCDAWDWYLGVFDDDGLAERMALAAQLEAEGSYLGARVAERPGDPETLREARERYEKLTDGLEIEADPGADRRG